MILFCGHTFMQTRNGSDPFALIKNRLLNNVVCLNIETALKGERQKEKHISLSVDESAFSFIPSSVQILSIVNNHAADSGNPEMLAKVIEKRERKVIGPLNPSVANMRYNEIDIDFFGAYFSLPRHRLSYNDTRAKNLIRLLLESNAEQKIVNLHWGYEHTDVPAPFQRHLAHRLIDAGANIIIGHHPHVPQGWEIYKEKAIFYSLGNFNFWQLDGETTEKNRWGYMVAYDLVSGDAKPIPYRINDNYQPFPVSREEEDSFISRVQQLSEAISEIDDQRWFKEQYANWYAREMKVWKYDCCGKFSPSLWVKWMIWLCMPMQLKYYAYTIWSYLRILLRRK